MASQPDRRQSGVRRDLNDLVRDESGRISGSKIGTYIGQGIAADLLLKHSHDLIDHWDSLAIMFTVLIAPEIWRKLMQMKYGQGSATDDPAPSVAVTTRTTVTP